MWVCVGVNKCVQKRAEKKGRGRNSSKWSREENKEKKSIGVND